MRKILFIVQDLSLSGSPQTVLHFIDNLPRDIESHVLVMCSKNKDELIRLEEYRQRTQNIYFLDLPNIYTTKFKKLYFYYMLKLMRFFKKINKKHFFDFYYLNRIHIQGFVAKYIKQHRKGKIIYNSLGNANITSKFFITKKLFERSTKLMCRFCDYFLAISSNAFPNDKFCIVGQKIILNDYSVLSCKTEKKIYSENGKIVLGQIGYYNSNKNQLFTLKLLEILISNGVNATAHFIGYPIDQLYFSEVLNFIRKNNLTSKVFFHSKDFEKKVFFDYIDILLLPSFSEGYPLVIQESIARKTPVLCSKAIPVEAESNYVKRLDILDDEWISYLKREEFKKNDVSSIDILKQQKENFKKTLLKIIGD